MQLLDLNLIDATSGQPRKTFYQETLEELAQSIKERGVLEPIVVRPVPGGRYQIVMGERRYRASRMAGLTQIPAIIRELSDEDATADALLENFQREDLNPVERANAVQQLLTFMSMDRCCRTLGVAESTLRRYLEILDLPDSIQRELANRSDEDDSSFLEGHARLLKAFSGDEKTQLRLAQKIKAEHLSIDETAKLIDAIKEMPEKAEAFFRVPLNVTQEILRHAGRTRERRKPFKPQTAEQHLKQVFKLSAAVMDLLDDRIVHFLSSEQMNQLLSDTSELAEEVEKFTSAVRVALRKNEDGFREVYIHCPLCGRIELIGSMRCGVCWTVLRRCYDCGYYDQMYQRCGVTADYVYMSEAESPDENSASYKCEHYKPRFEAKAA
ncbi:MAG: ParB/RepB/Spo0J family partition protein [Armatimonadetes bacterium]|nr:ParB/RepB/Spo0J family partition protein [Armatimonadota bacterium]